MKEEIKLPDYRELVGIVLHQADYFAFKKGNEAMEKFGVTMYQAVSLIYIAENEDRRSINQRTIEWYTGLSNPGVSKLIGTLVEKGYIERRRDQHDARNYCLHTTPEGKAAAARFHLEIALTDREICSRLTQDELVTLVKILRKIHI